MKTPGMPKITRSERACVCVWLFYLSAL